LHLFDFSVERVAPVFFIIDRGHARLFFFQEKAGIILGLSSIAAGRYLAAHGQISNSASGTT
jgi:hypothetical protein